MVRWASQPRASGRAGSAARCAGARARVCFDGLMLFAPWLLVDRSEALCVVHRRHLRKGSVGGVLIGRAQPGRADSLFFFFN